MDLEAPSNDLKRKVSTDQDAQDAQDLAELGHEQSLTRKFSVTSMLALTFCVLGTYYVFAQNLATGLNNGASITILWGLVLVTICNICVAVSLGELASSMPTALGQAYWVYRLWDTPLGRFTSYMCAWINTFGWWTLAASLNAFLAEFLLDIKTIFDPDWAYASKGWLHFVIYIGMTNFLTFINVVSCRKEQLLPWINNFVGTWYGVQFVVLSLALLISVGLQSNLSFQSATFVFGNWYNQTGWPDGVVWFIGLVQAAYGLTAFDSVIHMAEEIPAPRRNVPRIMWMAVLFGALTGFIFMVVCLFCIQDLDTLMQASLPFIGLMVNTVGREGGAALIVLFTFNGIGQAISVITTSSRLTWGFSRDGGLPWSRYLSHVDHVWQAPVRALWAQSIIISLVGVLYFFSTTALSAILSTSTVALTISYIIPILVLVTRGRDRLVAGPFHLGRWGLLINWVSIIYCAITTVFFLFAYSPHPTPSTMNYAIAVLGVMLVISIAFWFIQGNRTYLQTEESRADMIYARHLETAGQPAGEQHSAEKQ
ncbi:hypothetical protein PHISP_04159 [Aspergillus sp. HF37]|nr:hypothetical protein PHISP_04159 [Aspergillus sp. HF37]